MNRVPLTLVIKDYDQLAPLLNGDVEAEGLDLRVDRDTAGALDRTLEDPTIQVGEMSFSRHLIRLAGDDRSLVGIPLFTARGFSQRCFYARRDSGLTRLDQLAGKRAGTNEWPATGNTWSRAALRDQGVRIEGMQWLVGPVNDASAPLRPQGPLPSHVQLAPPGRSLLDMLIQGELDALMYSVPPDGFYEPDCPIVRVIGNYRQAEQDYYRRTGIYPGGHIIGVRRELYERYPWVLRSLYLAVDQAKNRWLQTRWDLDDLLPWSWAELEETVALMGREWLANGVAPNRTMIAALCVEELAQALISKPLEPESVFSEWEEAMNA